jgi:hypothetical protein
MVLLEDEADIAVYIERVKANSEKDRAMMAQAGKEMLRLQTEFFKEIKVVADEVGIYMPEPKDIEVLEDKISNPLVVLQNYNKQHNKTSPADMKEMISDAFRGIKPVFECEPGGSKYKGILSEMMEEIAFPKKEEIRFGSDINYNELLGEILTGIRIKNGKLIEKRG